jgi:sulfonate transport system permease protein
MSRIFTASNLRAIGPLALLFALWGIVTATGKIDPLILPSLGTLWQAMLDSDVQHNLLAGLVSSTVRLLEGAGIGIAFGLVFGVLLGLSRLVDRIVGPSFHSFRQIAIFAWIPLLTAWCGSGDAAKVVFVAMSAFVPTTMGAYEGVRNVSDKYLEVGQAFCFSRSLMLRRIIVPAALPAIVTGIQLAFIFSWLATVGAEYLMGSLTTGIGAFVMAGRENMRTDIVYLGIIVIAVIGVVLNKTLRRTTNYFFPWYEAP